MLRNIDVHIELLEKRSKPYWVFLLGVAIAIIFAVLFPKFIQAIYNFQLADTYAFQGIIESNIQALEWIRYAASILIISCFWFLAYEHHKKNYEKVYGKGSWNRQIR